MDYPARDIKIARDFLIAILSLGGERYEEDLSLMLGATRRERWEGSLLHAALEQLVDEKMILYENRGDQRSYRLTVLARLATASRHYLPTDRRAYYSAILASVSAMGFTEHEVIVLLVEQNDDLMAELMKLTLYEGIPRPRTKAAPPVPVVPASAPASPPRGLKGWLTLLKHRF